MNHDVSDARGERPATDGDGARDRPWRDFNATGFAVDVAGTSRPRGTPWDIGAYELAAP